MCIRLVKNSLPFEKNVKNLRGDFLIHTVGLYEKIRCFSQKSSDNNGKC